MIVRMVRHRGRACMGVDNFFQLGGLAKWGGALIKTPETNHITQRTGRGRG